MKKPLFPLALASAILLVACSDKPAPAAQTAPMPPPAAAAPAPAPSELASLRAYLGKYPNDGVNFLEQPPLSTRLKALLGERYPELGVNMGTVGPLDEEDGVLYITGLKPHEGGVNEAAVVIDPAQDALYVRLLANGVPTEFKEHGKTLTLPKDVQTTIDNTMPAKAN